MTNPVITEILSTGYEDSLKREPSCVRCRNTHPNSYRANVGFDCGSNTVCCLCMDEWIRGVWKCRDLTFGPKEK